MLTAVMLTDNDRSTLLHQTGTALVVVVLAITLGMLLAAVPLMRLFGKSGADALSRVMGLVLASVAVNMVYTVLTHMSL